LLAVAGAAYWLLIDNRTGPIAERPIDIAALRRAAAAMPGPRPDAIDLEIVAQGTRPPRCWLRAAVSARRGSRRRPSACAAPAGRC
jgi:hypothetical protein